MATVHLPAALSAYAEQRRRVEVQLPPEGATVAALLDALGAAHPGVRQRVQDEQGAIRPHVNVFVNGESIRYLSGLSTPLSQADEVWILPAVSGG